MSRLASIRGGESVLRSGSRLTAALIAGFLGVFLLFAAGFAQVSHDAAHDSRHSVAFPCH
ncbi:MAG: CbtB-domain containing protein [Rhodospirillales bacterium]|nr:MAG: CbtB-domain containing protein [Rhodospirillales bacterium]